MSELGKRYTCQNCGAKNCVVQIGVTPSQPGLLPVTGLVDHHP